MGARRIRRMHGKKSTRKLFVVFFVPNEENVRMDFIVGTRNYLQRWGHVEFTECTEKKVHEKYSLWLLPRMKRMFEMTVLGTHEVVVVYELGFLDWSLMD